MNPTEYIQERLKKYDQVIPHEDFDEIVAAAAFTFDIPALVASDLFNKVKGSLQIAEPRPRGVGKEHVWPAQERAIGTRGHPGLAAEPKSSQQPLGRIELIALGDRPAADKPTNKDMELPYVGMRVRMTDNPNPPWEAGYVGIIEHINTDKTLTIRDEITGAVYYKQDPNLIGNPTPQGRPDVRPTRPGQPGMGLMDSVSDSGNPNTKREYPGIAFMPKGQEGQSVVNPQSIVYKEAADDKIYSDLLDRIVLEYGSLTARNVVSYVKGDIQKPSSELKEVLRRYNLERKY